MSGTDLVPLAGGLTVPLHVVRGAIDLEARGLSLSVSPEGALVVSPRRLLSDDDRAFIRGNRDLLIAVVAYLAGSEQ